MGTEPSFVERRQFGRRWSHVHGWISIEGRPRIACVIKDFSESGARLDIADPSVVLNWFRLEIDVIGFAVNCQVRHHAAHSVGVRFVADEAGDEPHIIHTIDELMQRAMATDTPRTDALHGARLRRAQG